MAYKWTFPSFLDAKTAGHLMGAKSRNKGAAFEREIARDLRAIYDGPQWCAHYEQVNAKQRVVMLKSSRVKRGNQSRGAHEADLCVADRTWWIECQHADVASPLRKLEQAERDIQHKGEIGKWLPVSITKTTGARSVNCCMRGRAFVYLVTGKVPSSTPADIAPVIFPYRTFVELLEVEEARYRGTRRSGEYGTTS